MRIEVGTTVRLKVAILDNRVGAHGVCYSADCDLGRPSYGFIFEDGAYDGFSPDEVKEMLEVSGFSNSVEGYQFTNVMQLSRDFENGLFKQALI